MAFWKGRQQFGRACAHFMGCLYYNNYLKLQQQYYKLLLSQIAANLMDDDLKPLEFSWPAQQKTIRADIISNPKILSMLVKFVSFFIILCYGSRLLPQAQVVTDYTPEKWERVDVMELHQVSPLNRKIKLYVAPANDSEQIDAVYQADVFTLVDDQQKENRLNLQVLDIVDFTDISDNTLKFYLGDVHVLDQVAYRIKITKPIKVWRLLTDESLTTDKHLITKKQQTDNTSIIVTQSNQFSNTNLDEQTNSTQTNMTDINGTYNETQQARKQQQRIEEEKRRQEEEQRKKKEEEQARIRKQEQERKKAEEEQKKRQEQARQKIYDHTNIRIQAHLVSNFSTIIQLIIRYISVLALIYMVADNFKAPKIIGLICLLYANPLLFLQISYPNRVSNVIDIFCQSAPYLYLSLWLYYIHTKVKYNKESQYKVFLAIKMILGIILYLLNVLRLFHFQVLAWQTLVAIIVSFLVSLHIWEAFLSLPYQHHRDKVLAAVTITFFISLFTFKVLAGPWKDLISYIVIQLYSFTLIYLTGCPKKNKKLIKKEKSHPQSNPSPVQVQEPKQTN